MGDSAHHNDNPNLSRSVKELSILNDLARDIAFAGTVEEIAENIVRSAMKAVGAAQGVITLTPRDESSATATLVRTRHQSAALRPLRPTERLLERLRHTKSPIIIRSEDVKRRKEFGLDENSISSLIGVPLVAAGRLVGILTVYSEQDEFEFSDDDVRLLTIMAAHSAQLVERARVEEERRAIIQTFGQFTAPEVVDEILMRGAEMDGARRQVSIMFMDIRGFSGFAEQKEPEDVVAYLRAIFEVVVECINVHRGVVHQLLGDGLMAIFGAPISYGHDAERAVRSAFDMLDQIRKSEDSGRIPPTRLGIGIHTGLVVAGTIGTSIHREYKVTGDVVNVAARIEQLNKRFDSSLLISGEVYNELSLSPKNAVFLGAIAIDGRAKPIEIYRLA